MENKVIALFLALGLGEVAKAERDLRIPNEYEQAGSTASGILSTGTTEADATSSIQVNPALLVLNREYSVGVAYHWPDRGRNFYKLSVVDGVTSKYAAAVTYTGFQEDADALSSQFLGDSLVTKRASIGLAYPFQHFALGINANYQEGVEPKGEYQEVVKGLSMGFGAVALITKSIKFGASVQNVNNKTVEDMAPRAYRLGLSWAVVPEWTIYGDIRSRERVSSIEGPIPQIGVGLDAELGGLEDEELMAYLGNKVQIYNLVRLDFVYGSSLDPNDPRQSLSAGLGIHQKNYTFMYSLSKPYMEYDELHSAISLQILMKM